VRQLGLGAILRRTGDRLWTAYRHAGRNVELRWDEQRAGFSYFKPVRFIASRAAAPV